MTSPATFFSHAAFLPPSSPSSSSRPSPLLPLPPTATVVSLASTSVNSSDCLHYCHTAPFSRVVGVVGRCTTTLRARVRSRYGPRRWAPPITILLRALDGEGGRGGSSRSRVFFFFFLFFFPLSSKTRYTPGVRQLRIAPRVVAIPLNAS